MGRALSANSRKKAWSHAVQTQDLFPRATARKNLPGSGKERRTTSTTRQNKHPDLVIKTFVVRDELDISHNPKDLRSDKEVGALRWLNKRGCEYVPKLICAFKMRNWCGRKKQVVFMEKIDGVPLSEFYHLFSPEGKRQVLQALRVARSAVADCEIYNGSPFFRNVMCNMD